jgi:hypothetical protein
MAEKEKIIAQDVDECLFNSVKKHRQILTALGPNLGWTNLPTYRQICAAGGTHGAYKKYPGYWQLNKEMRDDPNFNSKLEIMGGALESMLFLQSMLGIYLTTRPEHLTKTTEEQLEEAGFPKREVVCRPRIIPLDQTTKWKLDVLGQLAGEKTAVMIDDSVSLYNAILKKNDPRIEAILFAGPLTPKGKGKTWKQIRNQLTASIG